MALRLATSMERVQAILPLRAESITRLTEDDEERIDAFLFRFSSLASIVQDQVGRALPLAEEEDLSRSSRIQVLAQGPGTPSTKPSRRADIALEGDDGRQAVGAAPLVVLGPRRSVRRPETLTPADGSDRYAYVVAQV